MSLLTDREIFRSAGRGKYNGNPCGECGGTLRYTKSRECVACRASKRGERRKASDAKKKEVAEQARQDAIRMGKITKGWGFPCHD